jgi:fibronectin type 3 domain-containing protein
MRFKKIPVIIAAIAILCSVASVREASSAPAPYPGGVHWVNIPVRTSAQAALGMNGGEGGQCIRGMTRCASDDNRIYFNIDVCGVWRSDDGGKFWRPCRMAGLGNNGTSQAVVSPTNHDVLITYTANNWQPTRKTLEGLYRSTNGGDTWTRVLAVPNMDGSVFGTPTLAWTSNGNNVYFAAYNGGGFYRSTNAGATWTGPVSLSGVTVNRVVVDPASPTKIWAATSTDLRVSTDSGSTWTVKASGGAYDISPDAATANRYYYVKVGVGLYRSNDGGNTWTFQSCGNSGIDTGADRIFQCPTDSLHMILTNGTASRVSTNGGTTWQDIVVDTSRVYTGANGWDQDGGIAWSNTNPNNIVAGNACHIYASTDGGVHWTDSSTGFTGFWHQWSQTAVSFAGSDPNRMATFCDDMSCNLTLDNGSTWFSKGLAAQVNGWWGGYAGDMSPTWSTTPTIVMAGGNYFNDDLLRTNTGTSSTKDWTNLLDANYDFRFVRFNPQNASIVYADNRRSNNGGTTWTTLTQAIRGMSPSNGSIVYAYSGGNVMKSTDTGTTWTTLPAPPAAAAGSIIAVHPTSPTTIWAITGNNVSKFNGTSWTQYLASSWVSSTQAPFVDRVAVDPTNGNKVVVGLDSNGTSYLFATTDGGTTWYDITGDLPQLGTGQSLNIQPVTGRIYIGMAFGTYATYLGGPAGGDTTAPTAPTNLASPSKTSTTVNLTWTGATDNVGVRAYDVTNVTWNNYIAASTMGTSYQVCGLSPSTAYTFKVVARDNAGNQTSSATLNVTTSAVSGAPAAPTGLTATGGNTQISLSWAASSSATSYKIYAGTTSGGETFNGGTATGTSFIATGATNGTTYYYKVTAVNAGGESGFSNEAFATASASATYNLFPTQTPSGTFNDGRTYELGTQFHSSQAGRITSIRFYKALSDSGTYTAHIWNASGGLVRTVTMGTFTTGVVGWQSVNLATAEPLNANTDCTVSVNTNSNYSATPSALPITSGPLTAMSGRFGNIGTYPNTTTAHNYFVDVGFTIP